MYYVFFLSIHSLGDGLTRSRYNSAVFELTTGRDYDIYFINASDVSTVRALASTKTNLTNENWESLYDTQYVPSVGDLYLIIDEFCLGVELDLNSSSPSWSYFLTTEAPASTDLIIPGGRNSTVSVNITLNATDMTYSTKQPSSILNFTVEAYDGSSMPQLTWLDSVFINASIDPTWKTEILIDDHGWLPYHRRVIRPLATQHNTLPMDSARIFHKTVLSRSPGYLSLL